MSSHLHRYVNRYKHRCFHQLHHHHRFQPKRNFSRNLISQSSFLAHHLLRHRTHRRSPLHMVRLRSHLTILCQWHHRDACRIHLRLRVLCNDACRIHLRLRVSFVVLREEVSSPTDLDTNPKQKHKDSGSLRDNKNNESL